MFFAQWIQSQTVSLCNLAWVMKSCAGISKNETCQWTFNSQFELRFSFCDLNLFFWQSQTEIFTQTWIKTWVTFDNCCLFWTILNDSAKRRHVKQINIDNAKALFFFLVKSSRISMDSIQSDIFVSVTKNKHTNQVGRTTSSKDFWQLWINSFGERVNLMHRHVHSTHPGSIVDASRRHSTHVNWEMCNAWARSRSRRKRLFLYEKFWVWRINNFSPTRGWFY